MTVHRLTALDDAFLEIEREGLPIHVASVGVFEGAPLLDDEGALRIDEIRAQVASRLDGLPRLRCRVAPTPLGLARPGWVEDPDFDVARHVDVVELPHGAGRDALRRYAERLVAEPLPRDRPLWHLRFVTGLSGGRVGVVERVHHALVDGLSGVDVATVLLDPSPEVSDPPPSTWTPPPPATALDLLAAGVADQVATAGRLARGALGAVRRPWQAARAALGTATALGTLVADGLVAPASSLNVPVGPGRRLVWISTDLEQVKAVGRRHGATANDVVLAAVAAGLRALLLARGEAVDAEQVLKVLVPVSTREVDERGTLGNRVGAMVLPLPVGLADPTAALTRIVGATQRLKRSGEATTTEALLAAADVLVPAPAVGPIARLTDVQRVVNVIVTNVPGPPVPLWCRGARLLEAYPVVPLGGNLSISVAILSYDGRLNLGITADASQTRGLGALRRGIETAVAELTGRPRRSRREAAPKPGRREHEEHEGEPGEDEQLGRHAAHVRVS